MERKRLDPALQRALDRSPDPEGETFQVFIETTRPVSQEDKQELGGMGVRNVRTGNQVFTASLKAHDIRELSDRPWISQIRLSTRMKYR